MAVLDKMKFWKKKDPLADVEKELAAPLPGESGTPKGTGTHQDLGLSSGYGEPFKDDLSRSQDLGFPKAEEQNFAQGMPHLQEERRPTAPKPQSFQQQPFPAQSQQPTQQPQQNIELLAAKIDTIRVSLESINHRLAAIERAVHVPQRQERPRRRRGVW